MHKPLAQMVIRDHSISNTFGMVRHHADGKPKAHQGWDLAAPVGTPVYAIALGTIEFVRDQGDYGKQIELKFVYNGKTLYAFYAHLATISVKKGDSVKEGQQMGTTGKSGNASNLPKSEEHLHFEIREIAHPGLGLAGRRDPATLYGPPPGVTTGPPCKMQLDHPTMRRYRPTPKHAGGYTPGVHGEIMDLTPPEATKLLQAASYDPATATNAKAPSLWGHQNGKIYRFMWDNSASWHGYPVKEKPPQAVLKQWQQSGTITQSEYGKILHYPNRGN
jgi:hypothetical protein